MSKQPNWTKLDCERLAAAQRQYDKGVGNEPGDCDGCKFWSELCASRGTWRSLHSYLRSEVVKSRAGDEC